MITPTERPINIKDLVIEAPKPNGEGPFDPMDALPENYFDNFANSLKNHTAFDQSTDLYLLRSLCPQKFEDLTIKSDHLLAVQDRAFLDTKHAYWPVLLMWWKTIRPDIDINSQISNSEKQKIHEELFNINIDKDWVIGNQEEVVALKIFFPELYGHVKSLAILRMTEELMQPSVGIVQKTRLAANLKLLAPDYFRDIYSNPGANNYIGAQLSSDFWQESRLELQKSSGYSILQTELALNLKILAAREVKFGNQGLELVMPEKPPQDQQTPPLPEARRF